MTIEEFLVLLKYLPASNFRLDRYMFDSLGAIGFTEPEKNLKKDDYFMYHPVQAVCRWLTGLRFDMYDTEGAADKLQMNLKDARLIDHASVGKKGYDAIIGDEFRSIRQRLVAAIAHRLQ